MPTNHIIQKFSIEEIKAILDAMKQSNKLKQSITHVLSIDDIKIILDVIKELDDVKCHLQNPQYLHQLIALSQEEQVEITKLIGCLSLSQVIRGMIEVEGELEKVNEKRYNLIDNIIQKYAELYELLKKRGEIEDIQQGIEIQQNSIQKQQNSIQKQQENEREKIKQANKLIEKLGMQPAGLCLEKESLQEQIDLDKKMLSQEKIVLQHTGQKLELEQRKLELERRKLELEQQKLELGRQKLELDNEAMELELGEAKAKNQTLALFEKRIESEEWLAVFLKKKILLEQETMKYLKPTQTIPVEIQTTRLAVQDTESENEIVQLVDLEKELEAAQEKSVALEKELEKKIAELEAAQKESVALEDKLKDVKKTLQEGITEVDGSAATAVESLFSLNRYANMEELKRVMRELLKEQDHVIKKFFTSLMSEIAYIMQNFVKKLKENPDSSIQKKLGEPVQRALNNLSLFQEKSIPGDSTKSIYPKAVKSNTWLEKLDIITSTLCHSTRESDLNIKERTPGKIIDPIMRQEQEFPQELSQAQASCITQDISTEAPALGMKL